MYTPSYRFDYIMMISIMMMMIDNDDEYNDDDDDIDCWKMMMMEYDG